MGKFRDILDEAEVILKGKDKKKIDVPTDNRGKPLSPSVQRIIKATQKMQSASGFKLRTVLHSIVQDLKTFQDEVVKKKSYDSVKYKYKKQFSKAISTLSNMVYQIKQKGLKAVEDYDEEVEQWEKLERYCKNITNWMKN